MERDWEEFMIPSPAVNGLHVTINDKGEILIGALAYARMGKPDAVVLLRDRGDGLVGLKPAHPKTANAYPIISVTNGRHKLVRANRFWRFHGIGFACRTVFESPKIEGDVLVIDPAATYPMVRRKSGGSV